MPETTHRDTIQAPADDVFALYAAFGDNSWMGVELTCEGEGVGAIRKVTLPTGVATEVCEELDATTRTMQYGLTDGNPFDCSDYHGRITVTPIDKTSCALEWTSRYEAADPAAIDEQLSAFLKRAGGALKRHAESQRP